jgi:hypothetical protein
MARPANIRIPPNLLIPEPPPEEPITVTQLRELLDVLAYFPCPESGDPKGARAYLNEGPQVRLVARQGEAFLLLVGRLIDVGMRGRKSLAVDVLHGEVSLLPALTASLRATLQIHRAEAHVVGRCILSDAAFEAAEWPSYLLGGVHRIFYMEPAS